MTHLLLTSLCFLWLLVLAFYIAAQWNISSAALRRKRDDGRDRFRVIDLRERWR